MTIKINRAAAFILSGLIVGLTNSAIADEDLPLSFQDSTISIVTATEIALGQAIGSVVSAELENDDGMLIWEVAVMGLEQQTVEVLIDATNGEFLQLEEGDKDD